MGTHRTFIATYIMAKGRNGTLYTGSTSNLESRVWKHKTRAFPGFTDENDCHHLVWFERHAWVVEAIRRERRIKKWMRDWKLALIERDNPDWRDLAADWFPSMTRTGRRRRTRTDPSFVMARLDRATQRRAGARSRQSLRLPSSAFRRP